ncbi:MAG TPA: hypothetical protein VIO43_13030 [Lutibacter sp.]
MKKFSLITVALFAFASITSQLLAQETDVLKTRTKSNQTNERTTGYDLKKAVKFGVGQTETGCSVTFEYDVKSPRDAASGLPTGKRQHGTVKIIKDFSVSASDNSVTEVKSPRDAASGQPSGKRMRNITTVTNELDKTTGGMGKGKVNMQDFSITKRCGGKTTKLSVVDGECVIPTDSCPDGTCFITADWSWGMSQSGSSKRCSVDFSLEIEDGVCHAINTKGTGATRDGK